VEFAEVLMVGGNGDMRIGNPLVDGARVIAEVLERGRDRKIMVFKYKNKTRYRRRNGHRQDFTRLAIRQILIDGRELVEEPEKKKPARAARKRAAPRAKPKPAAAEPEPTAEAVALDAAPVAETPVADAPAKPRRTARPKKTAAPKAHPSGDAGETADAPKPARRARAKKTESGE
jgi:large subunit ribosomal protein L21